MNEKELKKIRKIINDIKLQGDDAIIYYTKKFDGFDIKEVGFKVNPQEIVQLITKLLPELKESILQAKKRIEKFHKEEKKRIKDWVYKTRNIEIKHTFKPVEKVCIYIPGGDKIYFSTVLMCAIPAKVSGVEKIYLTTPHKSITPQLLYAANLCGVNEIYRIGGPMAIAAFAYGTKSVPKVDLIVGPGGKYVTLAKKIIYGEVGIDMLAGPSEICVYVDKEINYKILMYDLLSQAEHSKDSKAFLLTNNELLIKKISQEIPEQFKKRIKFYFTNSKEKAINLINNIAPEHLMIITRNSDEIIKHIKNAGAIFIGEYSPVTVGDYFAGPSHVLPTGSTAKFSSGLSVLTFLKRINIIKTNKNYIKENQQKIRIMAINEGFPYHAESISIRMMS